MQRPPGHAQNTPARATNSRPTTRRQRDATVREVDQGAKATESRVTWKGGVGGSPMGLKKGGGGRAYRPGRAGGTRESNWGRGRRRGCSGSQPFRMGQGVGGIIKRPFLVGCKGGWDATQAAAGWQRASQRAWEALAFACRWTVFFNRKYDLCLTSGNYIPQYQVLTST